MAKTWNFVGTLQENGNRVVSAATASVDTVSPEQGASARVTSVDGVAQFQFQIPEGREGKQGPQGPQGPAATLNLSIDGNTLLFS